MANHFDYIVLGAGYAGLASASLLSKYGKGVLLLESHYHVGGCTSFFRRKNFFFDCGATTISGVLPHQPLGILARELDIDFALKHLDIGMIIKTKKGDINRYADIRKWVEECNRYFPHRNHESFWSKLHTLEKRIWEIVLENRTFPPANLRDFASLVRMSNIKNVSLIKHLFTPFEKFLRNNKLFDNADFVRFINEQLLISTQSYCNTSPTLTSIMGLTYPAETYYPYGGIAKVAKTLSTSFTENKGELRSNEKVLSITNVNDRWEVKTSKGKVFSSQNVISSIPLWNMPELTHHDVQSYFIEKSKRFGFAWGAFMVYFAIETSMDLPTAYYQLHTSEMIPHCASRSFFVTISLADDEIKAPKGWKTITISTHTLVETWFSCSEDEYNQRTKETLQSILNVFDAKFPELNQCEKLWVDTATPRTFKKYTSRHYGYVGGIPHTVKQSLLSLPNNVTPFKGLYHIGDSSFPGQGIPSVVLGAINVVNRLL